VYPWGTCYVEDPSHSDLSLLRSMLFAGSMLTAKRKTLQLFEESYAVQRRAKEEAEHMRQRAAFQRERAFGRATMVMGAASMLGGAVAIFRPEWMVVASRMLDRLAATLARPDVIGNRLASLFAAADSLVGRLRAPKAVA